ncbi:MAG: HAMP domain-containing histidine kinase [Prevotella sp.]|jgi:signal transduction histidine kinase|nr:HAMP domain-containing histidine kinase [Prevotella sp.]
MKKSTIWILAGVMAFAFFCLLYLQINFFRASVTLREERLDDIVNRSLKDISRDFELAQADQYLDAFIEDQNKKAGVYGTRNQDQEVTIRQQEKVKIRIEDDKFDIEHSSIISTESSSQNQIFQLPSSRGKTNTISKKMYDMQEEQKKRFAAELENLIKVAKQITNTASHKPIEERVNFKELGPKIKEQVWYNGNGLELPFEYEVVDKNNKTIYPQGGLSEKCKEMAKRREYYSQALFPSDPDDKAMYLKVYFPTKVQYLMSELNAMYPAIGFTFILLVTFIITIYIIFRQKRLSEMKNDFMNNMTHELKTPVSTISLAAQMLKDGSIIKSPEVFKHISGVINDETERLSFQVEKVLQMSLFEKQKATLKMKELDVNDIVVSVANTFQLKVEKFGGNLDIDLEATESAINADKMHFTNVLFNLLDNAVKYRREDVPLELMIRTWNNNNKLYISVEDNGIGIKKEYVKKIFERFYRVSTGNRHDVKGFGLGLAYVKKIVEDHKGTIKAESNQGKGTKFVIALPVMKINE